MKRQLKVGDCLRANRNSTHIAKGKVYRVRSIEKSDEIELNIFYLEEITGKRIPDRWGYHPGTPMSYFEYL